jgi:hypothetical protein
MGPTRATESSSAEGRREESSHVRDHESNEVIKGKGKESLGLECERGQEADNTSAGEMRGGVYRFFASHHGAPGKPSSDT